MIIKKIQITLKHMTKNNEQETLKLNEFVLRIAVGMRQTGCPLLPAGSWWYESDFILNILDIYVLSEYNLIKNI